ELHDEEDALASRGAGFGASGVRDKLAGRGKASGLRNRRQALDAEEEAALQERVGDLYRQTLQDDSNDKGGKKGLKDRLSAKSFAAKRLKYAVGGGLVSIIFAALIGGFGMIGNFKLEHLFQNLDRTSLAKFNSA